MWPRTAADRLVEMNMALLRRGQDVAFKLETSKRLKTMSDFFVNSQLAFAWAC